MLAQIGYELLVCNVTGYSITFVVCKMEHYMDIFIQKIDVAGILSGPC